VTLTSHFIKGRLLLILLPQTHTLGLYAILEWTPPATITAILEATYTSVPEGKVHNEAPDYNTAATIFYAFDKKCASFGSVISSEGGNECPHIFAYDACLLSGCSGAHVRRLYAPENSACGFHVGGLVWRDERWPNGYNYAVSVSHPTMVLLFARYVAPSLLPNIPDAMKQYFGVHQDLLISHRSWIERSGFAIATLL
jgi:hypothetical protein